MVNFNNENTVTIPPVDILKIIILNRWWDLLEARETYFKLKEYDTGSGIHIIKARTRTLFDTIHATLKRKMKEEDFNKLKKCILFAKEEQDLDFA